MAALDSFTRYVRPEVPGCPELQIRDAILHAGIDFCKRTNISRETVTVATVAGTARYDLIPLLDAGFMPDQVLFVSRGFYDDLTPSNEREFLDNNLTRDGKPEFYYLDGNELVLGYTPNAVETLTVTVKAMPTEAATTLPDELYNRYRLQVAAGAKALLMVMRKQPWTDLEGAQINGGLFNAAIDKEVLRYAKGGGSKPLRTVSHIF
jgi:hypothetical protein